MASQFTVSCRVLSSIRVCVSGFRSLAEIFPKSIAPGTVRVQALGVISPLTVRSTVLAAKADEALASNRAVPTRFNDLFMFRLFQCRFG